MGDQWSDPAPVPAINTKYDELGPAPSADGRTLYFYSDRPGGLGGYDLWVTIRDDKGWQPPRNLGATINTAFNEYGPSLSPDGKTLFFSSNRPAATESQPSQDAWRATVREDLYRHDYDLYMSSVTQSGLSPPIALAALNSSANEGSPAFSPVGDFLYFASDRPGGHGGFDLYRARLVHGTFGHPENLGPTVNTERNELDPSVDMGGFSLLFSSDRSIENAPQRYRLYRTESREVFRDVDVRYAQVDWRGLWRKLAPNLFWAILALLSTLFLLALIRDMHRRRLSLMARCLLVSLLIHTLLMFFFNTVRVSATIASAIRSGGPIRVAMAGAGSEGALHAQIRGHLSEVSMPATRQASILRASAPAVTTPWTPARADLTVDRSNKTQIALIRPQASDSSPSPQRLTSLTAKPSIANDSSFSLPSDIHREDRGEVDSTGPAALGQTKIAHARTPVATSQPSQLAVLPTDAQSGRPSAMAGTLFEPSDVDHPTLGVASQIGSMAVSSMLALSIPGGDSPQSVTTETVHVPSPSTGQTSLHSMAQAPIGTWASGDKQEMLPPQSASIPGHAGFGSAIADVQDAPLSGEATHLPGFATSPTPSINLSIPGDTGGTAQIAFAESAGPPGPPTGLLPAQHSAPLSPAGSLVTASSNLGVSSAASSNAPALIGDLINGKLDAAPAHGISELEPGIGAPGPSSAFPGLGIPTEVKPPDAPPTVPAPVLAQTIGRILGVVTDAQTGLALSGAKVRLDVAGESPVEATTDESGRYAMAVPEIPEHFAMSASMTGHLPKTRTAKRRSLHGKTMRLNFALDPERANVVAIEDAPVIHHLGNDRYEGAVNSQFQREAEGDRFFTTFDLRADQAPPNCAQAAVEMLAKGVQCPHKIRINGHLLPERLTDSPGDGTFGTQQIQIDAELLHEGVNTFEIRAISCNGDLDDFEFINLQITIVPRETPPPQ
jgi:hypothetical protein